MSSQYTLYKNNDYRWLFLPAVFPVFPKDLTEPLQLEIPLDKAEMD
jgi:hypothetical protein